MIHQITLEELGLIPKTEKSVWNLKNHYAYPCGGCICHHCANSVECVDQCAGEMNFGCFDCDECIEYDGKGVDRWKQVCNQFKITDSYAEKIRKELKVMKE